MGEINYKEKFYEDDFVILLRRKLGTHAILHDPNIRQASIRNAEHYPLRSVERLWGYRYRQGIY